MPVPMQTPAWKGNNNKVGVWYSYINKVRQSVALHVKVKPQKQIPNEKSVEIQCTCHKVDKSSPSSVCILQTGLGRHLSKQILIPGVLSIFWWYSRHATILDHLIQLFCLLLLRILLIFSSRCSSMLHFSNIAKEHCLYILAAYKADFISIFHALISYSGWSKYLVHLSHKPHPCWLQALLNLFSGNGILAVAVEYVHLCEILLQGKTGSGILPLESRL